MFYCNECAEINGYPQSIGKSNGTCELCGKVRNCNNMSSTNLPLPKNFQSKSNIVYTMDETKHLKEIEDNYYKIEIDDLAWQVFQDRLGIGFKRPLTDDEKKSITDKKDYQRYRDEATRLYMKRQTKKEKAVLNKKYTVIDVPASGKSEWMGGAYTLCFVYSKYKGNFVLRGYVKEVEEYLKKNYTHYFYNLSLWYHGNNRDIWHFWKDNIVIHEPRKDSKIFKGKDKWKWQVRPYVDWRYDIDEQKREKETLWFKRMPKRWIPEFNKF